jgi:hypothetical protein
MNTPIRDDAREQVDRIVQQHAIYYSLFQLRLLGMLLLLMMLSRMLVLALPGNHSNLELLSAITALSNWLLLLPVGICLYLLGGGQRRQRHEVLISTLLHRSLVALALVSLLLLPLLTLQQTAHIDMQRKLQGKVLQLSPYQQEILSPQRTAITVMLQMIAGAGLLALHQQGSREIRRHGLTPTLFFGCDLVKRRRPQRRPESMPRPRKPRRSPGGRLPIG